MRPSPIKAVVLALALLGSAGCGDDEVFSRDDAGPGIDAADIDGGPSSGSALDRPGLPRPPSGGLPADLRPPR